VLVDLLGGQTSTYGPAPCGDYVHAWARERAYVHASVGVLAAVGERALLGMCACVHACAGFMTRTAMSSHHCSGTVGGRAETERARRGSRDAQYVR